MYKIKYMDVTSVFNNPNEVADYYNETTLEALLFGDIFFNEEPITIDIFMRHYAAFPDI